MLPHEVLCFKSLQEDHGIYDGNADTFIDQHMQFRSHREEMQFKLLADEL
jgi:hypothetical protein